MATFGTMNPKTFANKMSLLKAEQKRNIQRYRQLDEFARVESPENGEFETRTVYGNDDPIPSCSNNSTDEFEFEEKFKVNPINAEPLPPSTSNNEKSERLDRLKATFHSINSTLHSMEAKIDSIYELQKKNTIMLESLMKMVEKLNPECDTVDLREVDKEMPISSIAKLSKFEDRLANQTSYRTLVERYLKQCQSEELNSIFRGLIADSVLILFNWDGRAGKQALNSMMLFNKLLFECCASHMGRHMYVKKMRSMIELSHNRFSKQKLKDATSTIKARRPSNQELKLLSAPHP